MQIFSCFGSNQINTAKNTANRRRCVFAFVFAVVSTFSIDAQAYREGVDLISLHYDFAPDRDDAHASVSAMTLTDTLNIQPLVVTGTTGDGNRSRYIADAVRFQNVVWGINGHVPAMERWDEAVSTVANIWTDVIDRGGKVFVAEGGQSDFTADVIRLLINNGNYNRNDVEVIQHSIWNEEQSSQQDLNFVRQNTVYLKIEDGNGANATADLNQKSNNFLQWASNRNNSNKWDEAFNFLNPDNKLDFSDTVELLHILDIGLDQISSPDTFSNYIDSINVDGHSGTVINVARDNTNNDTSLIVVEAESYLSKDAGWTVNTAHGGGSGTYLELLPDTRVTHSDPLIPGQNFWDRPGDGPTVIYNIDFPAPGDYLVEVSAYSTGSEDNGIHVGINGSWSASGARMQWCTGKNQWTWSSAQRTSSNHCGEPGTISINVPRAGMNQVMFSAREDGFEFDQFRLTALGNIEFSNNSAANSDIAQPASGTPQSTIDNIVSMPGNVAIDSDESVNPLPLDAETVNLNPFDLNVENEQCMVSAEKLGTARALYARHCPSLPRIDCDPQNGLWYCASYQIGSDSPSNISGSSLPTVSTDKSVSIAVPTNEGISQQDQNENALAVENPLVPPELLPADITDLILITGELNTLGTSTLTDNDLDNQNPRVFAFTRAGWKVAELYQSWDGDHPGTGSPENTSNRHNNFALHFGKRLVELDENIVVGFVLVSEPGEGIEHWDPGNAGLLRLQQKAFEAINELPHKTSIDGVLWHQGETDWKLEGTSDPDVVQPAETNYYPNKLKALVNNLRLESWFNESRPFICGETLRAAVNDHLNGLNSDSDPKTACVSATDLSEISEGSNRFDAHSLRVLGQRYAEVYFLNR